MGILKKYFNKMLKTNLLHCKKIVNNKKITCGKANPGRDLWYPGAQTPSHLKGEMIGDYGFDPLRIGVNSDLLPWYIEAELTHGRWAMVAVAGILMTDSLGLGNWWEAGSKNYSLDVNILIPIQIIVMTIFEAKRYENITKVGEGGLLGFTPFDPANMRSDEMRVKEIKNGRLAMVAFIGFCSQAAVTNMGPIECVRKHIENPQNFNIFTSSVGFEATVAVVIVNILPMFIEAKKSLSTDSEEEFRPIPW